MTRLRQLKSVLETQFSGDTILLIFGDGTSPALLLALIAGIPLNRVHELEYKPGEIRYDVTRDAVLASMPSEKSADYLVKISRGKETLKELREELTRPEVEDLVPIRPVAVVQEPSINTGQRASSTQVSANDMLPFLSLGAAAAAAAAVVASSRSTDIDGNQEDEVADDIESAQGDDTAGFPEIQKMEKLVSTAPFDIPEMNANLHKDSKMERIQTANDAMNDYLNRDDGGEDWLTQMASIMDEE